MTFADLLDRMGGMGRFQILHITLLVVPVLLTASHNLLQNFSAAIPEHHCRVRLTDNDTERHINWTRGLGSEEELLWVSIPKDEAGKPEKCRRFVAPHWHLLGSNATGGNLTEMETEPCHDGWIYDRSIFTNTIIMEWDLVCSLRTWRQVAQSIYMGGVLVGALVFGSLADRFGRKAILSWSYLQMAVSGVCTALSPTFLAYCLFRFLVGMALSGIILNCMSLVLEWVPTKVRTVAGTVVGYCATLGQILLPGLAYALPDWRWLQFATSMPFFVFFLYSWWFAESARWLVLAGKPEKAVEVLRKVALINGKQDEGEKLNTEVLKSNMQKEMALAQSSHTLVSLVRTPTVRRISCCISSVWFATSFSYYGLAMDLQNFGFSLYLIQVAFGSIDIPAKLGAAIGMSYVGRRATQASSLILAGLAILANIFVPPDQQTLRTSLAVLGKGCLASSFNCLYLYTGELFPTVIRYGDARVVSWWEPTQEKPAPSFFKTILRVLVFQADRDGHGQHPGSRGRHRGPDGQDEWGKFPLPASTHLWGGPHPVWNCRRLPARDPQRAPSRHHRGCREQDAGGSPPPRGPRTGFAGETGLRGSRGWWTLLRRGRELQKPP